MKRLIVVLLVVSTSYGMDFSLSASAATVLYDNGPSVRFGSVGPIAGGNPEMLAADFTTTSTWMLDRIDFGLRWGADGLGFNDEVVDVQIRSESGGTPGNLVPGGQLGDLFTFTSLGSNTGILSVDMRDLVLESGTYFAAIQVFENPVSSGRVWWGETNKDNVGLGTYKSPNRGDNWAPSYNCSFGDMSHIEHSFQVHGTVVPAPSSLTCMAGLFAMGLVATWWRRWKAAS